MTPLEGARSPAERGMDLKETSLLGTAPERHWYYRSKLAAMTRITAGRKVSGVLDVGSGSGFFPRQMLLAGLADRAVCVDPGYASDSDEEVGGRPLLLRREVAGSDADLVLMMDVLEHVPDDAGLVAEYVGKVASGTAFFATVPAFQWLWSGHDVFLEHHRRYTVRGLEAALGRGGVRVEGGCYFYGAVFPAAAAMRLAARLPGAEAEPRSQMRPAGRAANAVLSAVCRAETAVMRANRVGGLTAVAWGVKP